MQALRYHDARYESVLHDVGIGPGQSVPETRRRVSSRILPNRSFLSPPSSCSEHNRLFDSNPPLILVCPQITKIGRYGRTKADFDYSPERVRASLKRSMELMGTTYLDGVYAHDVEFVSEQLDDAGEEGWKVSQDDGKIRDDDLARWGLRDEDAATIRGPGDEKVLAAMKTLFELKKEGLIRAVGFSGQFTPRLFSCVFVRVGSHRRAPR